MVTTQPELVLRDLEAAEIAERNLFTLDESHRPVDAEGESGQAYQICRDPECGQIWPCAWEVGRLVRVRLRKERDALMDLLIAKVQMSPAVRVQVYDQVRAALTQLFDTASDTATEEAAVE